MENKTVEESIITAMDGTDIALIKYLPYILQDFWEIGSSPDEIIKIIKKHKTDYSQLGILDLGSGKGAVSVRIASELKCRCFGIDAIDEFVAISGEKAKEFSVNNLCTFETGDLRIRIKTLDEYDVVILGAIGPVFGDYYSTLLKVKPHLKHGGLLIFDYDYIEDDRERNNSGTLRKSEVLKQTADAGMEIIDTITNDDIPGINEEYETQFKNVKKRCMELSKKYPEDKELFLAYVEKQKEEYWILSNTVTSVTLVLKSIN